MNRKAQGYSAAAYEDLFDRDASSGVQPIILRHEAVANYRARTIKAGDQLEAEIYPIWNCRSEASRARKKRSRAAQREINRRNARKKLIRKINANFGESDLMITLTYKGALPSEDEARKDIRNYLRRIRKYRKRHGMSELKYIYVIEFAGGDGRRKRIHHHVIISGMDRDAAEKLWNGKGYANAKKLQPDEYGLEALARYITKAPNGSKRWCCSRNLIEPKESTADHKMSKRRVEQMAIDFDIKPGEIFSRIFPEYEFLDCQMRFSQFVAGAYIYARMRRRKR